MRKQRADWTTWQARRTKRATRREPRRPGAIAVGALALVTVLCSVVELDERFGGDPPASAEEKAKGQWWDRHLIGVYFPAARLK